VGAHFVFIVHSQSQLQFFRQNLLSRIIFIQEMILYIWKT
jgi:hypothetical protein